MSANPTVIALDQPIATLINVFTCTPDRQAELVAEWIRMTEETMQHLPGFISANVHASNDGEKVINYAQWESEAAFQATLQDPVVQKEFARLAQLAISLDPRLYSVKSVHHI